MPSIRVRRPFRSRRRATSTPPPVAPPVPSAGLEIDDVRHDCQMPDTSHLPRYGDRYQRIASFICPVCEQRWDYKASFLHGDKFMWERGPGGPSGKWLREERRRLAAASNPSAEETY